MALLDLGCEQSLNPCKKFIKFKNGKFQYWDKTLEKKIGIDIPLKFFVLFELQTAAGYHDPSKSAIYSNEVYRGQQEMNVKSWKGGFIAKGFWPDIKDTVKAAGGKFCNSIYAFMDGEIVNFHFQGATCGAWIERSKGDKIKVEKLKDMEKGVTQFKVPVFETESITPEELKKAQAAGKELKEYLLKYLTKDNQTEYQKQEDSATAKDFDDIRTENTEGNEEEKLPF